MGVTGVADVVTQIGTHRDQLFGIFSGGTYLDGDCIDGYRTGAEHNIAGSARHDTGHSAGSASKCRASMGDATTSRRGIAGRTVLAASIHAIPQ